MHIKISLLAFGALIPFLAAAQLKIDTSFTPEHMVDKILVGNGVRVGNIKMTGAKIGLGYFRIDTSVIGMKSGILLASGSVFNAKGPNDSPAITGFVGKKGRKGRGDRDLNKICKGTTHDAMVLEFDFIPFHNRFYFSYCFGSEEYLEYVNSAFNDAFAFIIEGPGMQKQNLALIPGTKTPVTINNVNDKKNSKYYVNNDYFVNVGMHKKKGKAKTSLWRKIKMKLFGKQSKNGLFYVLEDEKRKLNQALVNEFQYDGFTRTIKAECFVTPFVKYRLKIVVADVGDGILDSGVFLQEGSLTSTKDTTQVGFIAYTDRSSALNFDSIFGVRDLPSAVKVEESPEENFEITNIYFDYGKHDIPDTLKKKLDELAAHLVKNENLKCELYGYTDNRGSASYNRKLSENRAIAVMYYLTMKGVARDRLKYQGNSFFNPAADNTSESGRAMNRRVEILIIE